MNIVFFTHPEFLGSQSMPRYANWLAKGMENRGHNVQVWAPKPKFFNIAFIKGLKKWHGYIDQYIVFPNWVEKQLKMAETDTLYVFSDHALGPWVPLVKDRRHVIHCHDFLAQRSALGEVPQNMTGKTGRVYQSFIRRGYKLGKNFISISNKTALELHRFLGYVPKVSEVVYNGLLHDYSPSTDVKATRKELYDETGINLTNGYLLHVGGNQWYKNRVGVIKIYDAWRKKSVEKFPLLMVGAVPSVALKAAYDESEYSEDIYFLTGKDDSFVYKAYTGASVFLFPSLAEGFGWPIAEAMASGIPVITTGEAPMNEVGGSVAYYIRVMPQDNEGIKEWANESADVIKTVFSTDEVQAQQIIAAGLAYTRNFDSDAALDKIETIYKRLLQ